MLFILLFWFEKFSEYQQLEYLENPTARLFYTISDFLNRIQYEDRGPDYRTVCMGIWREYPNKKKRLLRAFTGEISFAPLLFLRKTYAFSRHFQLLNEFNPFSSIDGWSQIRNKSFVNTQVLKEFFIAFLSILIRIRKISGSLTNHRLVFPYRNNLFYRQIIKKQKKQKSVNHLIYRL